ncbi:SpvB/TcaC N-terminal domain-containing protein [Streptomyces sp. NPDC059766]|uniref:SpvB/TcaC N-terminal domain-containing protein n=1 Tax=Streptomyces sp. NPDC059766 TaxID=3346940 RepID=UPI003657ADBC
MSLPKGGGAIKGIGEKFAADPVTGAGALRVPVAVSPGRAGFGPQVSLTYGSGSGNGPFGLGWSVDLPAITRKTDKGLPRYDDDAESDVFILSGAEDLAPVLVEQDGGWVREQLPARTVGGTRYHVRRYRPRVEGLFARIELWRSDADPTDVFWRTISRDNVTTWYGRTPDSRVADPDDLSHVFAWLVCASHDDKGNLITYGYKPENDEDVDLGRAGERNRQRRANRYPKRIRYGNHAPYLPTLAPEADWPALPADDQWYFELVFDYGEHDATTPLPQDASGWQARPDAFSTCRPGFEVRTHRLCRRVLMFHHFPDEPEVGVDCLVRSTDFTYAHDETPADPRHPVYAKLTAVTQRGYRRQGTGYHVRSFPPAEFGYTEAVVQDTPGELSADSAANLPAGLDGSLHRWVDLDGEGLSGVLTEQGGAWLYKRNLSPLGPERGDGRPEARLGPVEVVTPVPGLSPFEGAEFLDLAGDGRPDIVRLTAPVPGFHQRSETGGWEPFTAFRALPNLDWDDPNLRFVDLDGDGHADVLITEDDALVWNASLAGEGFGPGRRTARTRDEERGPALVFADGEQSVHLADMTGDGLTDLVRIRNGEVCYWPNLGHGRFGPKVTMDDAPSDRPEHFDRLRVRLADIDGSGTTDIIYLHADGVRVYFNQSGNGWGPPLTLSALPPADSLTQVAPVDLFGNGTACLVWSSPQPADARRPLRYLDLMGGQKPHLLINAVNNLGAETEIRYAPSTRFYLRDRLASTPWVTKLPFPVHVVERVTVRDKWQGTSFSSTYSYHHGYFDGPEREFRGFARVERVDAEDYGTFGGANAGSPFVTPDHRLYQPPVKTVSWYHTGAWPDGERVLHQLQREYFPSRLGQRPAIGESADTFREHDPPDPDLDAHGLPPDEQREALRACRGLLLREEVYELDVAELAEGRQTPIRLFTATSHSCRIRLVQPRSGNRHAVFHVTDSEAVGYHYELDLRTAPLTPDPRITHTLHLRTDEYGNALQTVTVGYPRRQASPDDPLLTNGAAALIAAVQGELHLAYAEQDYTRDRTDDPDSHRLRLPCESQTCELTGIRPADAGDGRYFTLDGLRAFKLSDRHQTTGTPVGTIAYHELPDRTTPQKRPVEHTRSLFFDEALTDPLPLRDLTALALPYETYTLTLTDALLTTVLGDRLTPDVTAVLDRQPVGGYLSGPDLTQRLGADTARQYWRCSGIAGYRADARLHFLLPERYTDPFGNVTLLDHDPRDLFLSASTDALGNRTEVTAFDFRVLAPRRLRDANGNRTEVLFDSLGMPTATALSGKGGEGDDLTGLDGTPLDPDLDTLTAFFVTDDYDPARAAGLLGRATARHLYHFGETAHDGTVVWAQHPPCTAGIVRERHTAEQADSPVQTTFEYSDGAGNLVATKVQAEPAVPGGPLRWVGRGRTVLNNKGKPVKQYEPYFSAPEVGHRYEEAPEAGVTPVLFYDAVGRLVRTESPDGAFSRAEYSPWQVTAFDANDTVLEPGNTWHARMSASAVDAERRAARLAAAHAGTPALTLLDSLGRSVVTVAHNRTDGVEQKHVTFVRLDAEGKELWTQDARGNRVVQHITPPVPDGTRPFDDARNILLQGFAPCYDIAGHPLFQHSMDAGERRMLHDAAERPIFTWNSRGFRSRTTYDALHRPVGVFVSAAGDTTLSGAPRDPALPPDPEALVEYRVYGETHPDSGANLRSRLHRSYDGAGVTTSERYDFKGNLIEGNRRFTRDYKAVPDWSVLAGLTDPVQLTAAAEPLLESAPPLGTQTRYDALNRPTTVTTPDGSIHRAAFNPANLLESVEVSLRGVATGTPFITNIDYNARGQRVRIDYGNGASTAFDYDPVTFRLNSARTTRPPVADVTASVLFANATVVQDLRYTYDPVGNVTRIEDAALRTTVQAGAACDYTHDALYRLVAASGREHSGQTDFALAPSDTSRRDHPFVGARIHPNDLQGLRDYVERYRYDAVGNLMAVAHHTGQDVDQPGQTLWQRHHQYALASNRLLSTSLPGDPADLPDYAAEGGHAAKYGHDVHGNIVQMPHLPLIRWDHKDQLAATAQQVVNDGTPETTYYVYDSAGRRARKVTETQSGALKNERRYLGDYEIYREHTGSSVTLERETLHVQDGRLRAAVVETSAIPAEPPRIRFQLGNHLGSSCAELDQGGALIAYEDYHPYGTTAFQTGHSAAEVGLKRYRYTGKERDDETGFGYHGARYYAPWLGRWASADPLGIGGGVNVYAYASANPVTYRDPSGLSIEQNVLNELKDTFKQKGIAYAEEVSFYVLDESGKRVINAGTGKPLEGRSDLVWEDPETGKIKFLEGKGTASSSKTVNQEQYIPEFEKGGGWEIKGTKGGNLGLGKGVRGSVKGGGFKLVHSGDLKQFIAENLAKFKTSPGKSFRFVTVSASGERSVKFFNSAEELGRFQTARGSGTPGQIEPAAGAPEPASSPGKPAGGTGTEPRPAAQGAPNAGAKPPASVRFTNAVGGLFHVLNVYTAYKEIQALVQGKDLTPNGYYDYGLGGRVINDFKKLPEGFSSSVISAPDGYGPGFYEKRNGDIYKDGKLLHIMQEGRLVSGGA